MPKEELVNKIKGKLNKNNFLVMILLGVLLLVIVWPVEDQEKTISKSGQSDSESVIMGSGSQTESFGELSHDSGQESLAYAVWLEESLEELLGSMEGAGKVRVMVTLEDLGESVAEKDTVIEQNKTTEADSEGGKRSVTELVSSEETVFDSPAQEGSAPYIKKRYAPKVAGVVVCAQGGENPVTINNITEAIQALFGIEAHKIKIVKMISQ